MRWGCGAGGGNRTHTSLRTRDFESRASASFTTPARRETSSITWPATAEALAGCAARAGRPTSESRTGRGAAPGRPAHAGSTYTELMSYESPQRSVASCGPALHGRADRPDVAMRDSIPDAPAGYSRFPAGTGLMAEPVGQSRGRGAERGETSRKPQAFRQFSLSPLYTVGYTD